MTNLTNQGIRVFLSHPDGSTSVLVGAIHAVEEKVDWLVAKGAKIIEPSERKGSETMIDILQGFHGYHDIWDEGPGGPQQQFTYGGWVKNFAGDVVVSVAGKTSRHAAAIALRSMLEAYRERVLSQNEKVA